MKASLPWYTWYPGDFLNTTRGWSLPEKGAFREALDTQWAMGSLPVDPEEFRRTIGATPQEWRSIWPKIEPQFPVDVHGLRRNPRLARVQEQADHLRAERSKYGRKGADSRWPSDGNSHGKRHGKSHQFANGKTVLSTSTSTSTSTSKSTSKIGARVCPDGDAHARFAEIRKAYPKFSGRQDWDSAFNRACARVERDGATWDGLVKAVHRYRAYVNAGGASGPQYVLNPNTFFSAPDQPWAQSWTPTPTMGEQRRDSNIEQQRQ